MITVIKTATATTLPIMAGLLGAAPTVVDAVAGLFAATVVLTVDVVDAVLIELAASRPFLDNLSPFFCDDASNFFDSVHAAVNAMNRSRHTVDLIRTILTTFNRCAQISS
jgi:hypothetical protein